MFLGSLVPMRETGSQTKGEKKMARNRLVCNLGMADFFTLDDGEVWRKKGGEKIYKDVDGKKTAGYLCESLYDCDKQVWLPANQRVDLVDQ